MPRLKRKGNECQQCRQPETDALAEMLLDESPLKNQDQGPGCDPPGPGET